MSEPQTTGAIEDFILDTPVWMNEANCLDIDPFDKKNQDKMLERCAQCPVFKECSEYARGRVFMSSVIAGRKPEK